MLPTKKKAKPGNGFACKKVTNCFIILQGFLEWFLEWLLLPERLVAELGQQAGVADLTPHRLRHSCAKALLDSGATLPEVAKLMGHSRLDTTMRYVLPSEHDLAAAVEKI